MIDELPPHDIGSEQALLGCIMLDPKMVIPEVSGRLKSEEVFFDLRHRTIYDAMVCLYDERKPVEIVSLQERLKEQGSLDSIGGFVYLSGLEDATPSSFNYEYYLEIVLEKYLRRKVLALSAKLNQKAKEGDTAQEMIDLCEREMAEVSKEATGDKETTISDSVNNALEYWEACWNRETELIGLSTGLVDLDKQTQGLKDSEMFVLAGRPSTGKTSLAMNIAEHIACDQCLPVGVFSLEMSEAALTRRMVCSRARVNEHDIYAKNLPERGFQKLAEAGLKFKKSPLYIDDSPALNILQIRSRARRMHQRYGIKLLIVDYLQLLQALGHKSKDRNRQQEIADISNGLKSLLKELGIPGLILSQLNRDVEKEKHRKPRLSDLRESGAIEQDADIVGMLYRPEEYEVKEESVILVNCYIAKQRNGPTGDVNLTFLKTITRFEAAAKKEDVVKVEQKKTWYNNI